MLHNLLGSVALYYYPKGLIQKIGHLKAIKKISFGTENQLIRRTGQISINVLYTKEPAIR